MGCHLKERWEASELSKRKVGETLDDGRNLPGSVTTLTVLKWANCTAAIRADRKNSRFLLTG